MKAKGIVEALRKRHNKREWAFFAELRVGTGYSSKELRKAGINPEQRIDGYVINLYPSKNL